MTVATIRCAGPADLDRILGWAAEEGWIDLTGPGAFEAWTPPTGAWAVVGQGGMILKRGHDLDQVLKVFDTRRFRVVE